MLLACQSGAQPPPAAPSPLQAWPPAENPQATDSAAAGDEEWDQNEMAQNGEQAEARVSNEDDFERGACTLSAYGCAASCFFSGTAERTCLDTCLGEKLDATAFGRLKTQVETDGKTSRMLFESSSCGAATITAAPVAPADVAAAPKTAKRTPSGLAYSVLTKGTGKKKPTASSTVTVHYSGWTTDGRLFDSSVVRGAPTSFRLDQVIKGWTEGVQLMAEGEKVRFWIPGSLAYGDTPTRPGAPSGTLVFDVELLEISDPPTAPL